MEDSKEFQDREIEFNVKCWREIASGSWHVPDRGYALYCKEQLIIGSLLRLIDMGVDVDPYLERLFSITEGYYRMRFPTYLIRWAQEEKRRETSEIPEHQNYQ